MPDNEADSTTNQHHHILSLQKNASLIRVVSTKICVLHIFEKDDHIYNFVSDSCSYNYSHQFIRNWSYTRIFKYCSSGLC